MASTPNKPAPFSPEPQKAPVSAEVKPGDATVSRDDVQRTVGPAAPVPEPFISEGVRNDLLMYGTTIDPLTGRTLTRDDLK